MDVNKHDSRCSSREGVDMSNNYSDQFSDSYSINGMQCNTNQRADSPPPCEDDNTQQKAESNSDQLEGSSTGQPSANLSSPNPKKSSQTKQVSLSSLKPNLCSSSLSSSRDESEIKKEDVSPSPLSPLGFSVQCHEQSNCETDDNNGQTSTLSKLTNHISPLSGEKNNVHQFAKSVGGCNSDLKESSASTVLDNISSSGPSSNIERRGLLNANLNPYNGCLTKFNNQAPQVPDCQGLLNSSGDSIGSGGCNEYMQQQNHVFVFSTQLANKSAEAVLGGQFPTIIAYHCMQPSTKLFLEDFLKNPAKSSKMQKQYSLNIMNAMQPGTASPSQQYYWLNDFNNCGTFSQRLALCSAGPLNKLNGGWDQTTDQPAKNPLHILYNADTFDTTKLGLPNVKLEDKSDILSLQGIKVPDENLTPQQRQHREEQLAKLKKMNKFLFPENGGGDFNQVHLANSAPNPDAINLPVNSIDTLHNNLSGICPDVSNKIYQAPMRNITGNFTKSSEHLNPGLDHASGTSDDDTIIPSDIVATVGVGDSSPIVAMQPNKHGCVSKMNNSNLNIIKSETVATPGMENSLDMVPDSIGGTSNMNMPQEEWVKFQNGAFQDGFKIRHSNVLGNPGTGGTSSMICQQNPSLSRSHSMGGGTSVYGMKQTRPNTGPTLNSNVPPPPYHQIQRSASVPISTQSPNHTNNTNTDRALPSPQGTRAPFNSSTPPIIDNAISSSSLTLTNQNLSVPTSCGITTGSILNNMNSNPSLTNSHISTRDIDCLESVHKVKMSSPQRFKGASNINGIPDMEAKYANFALNYPTCGGMSVGAPNMRQNMQQMPSQFSRRIDMSSNIPLNPNCNRITHSKNTGVFDPISSLAQMSQQLTSCGVGLSAMNSGNSFSGGGLLDVNSAELIAGHSGRSDQLDHCNQSGNTNNIGVLGMGGGVSPILCRSNQFPSDINLLCGETSSMDQRMVNGKICVPNMSGNFNPNSLNGIGCNETISSNCGRRMLGNFDNFNISSNVHVKASAPNTIQYMPTRSQNLNNMRVPPSIEFFQRFSNPQMGNVGAAHPAGHGSLSNDMSLNMFGNCNQMSSVMGSSDGGGFESNDLELENNLIPNDDYMNVR